VRIVRLHKLFALTAALYGTAFGASGQTVVNSTFLGGDHHYNNPANWSPAEVPNNTADKSYNVAAPSSINLDTDATVTNLTISGPVFGSQGHSYTVTGTTTVGASSLLQVNFGAFTISGSLSNFDAATRTLTGGSFSIFSADGGAAAGLRFPGADIVTNGASISLTGPTATMTDSLGRDAFRNFAHNLSGASFSVAVRDYTINHVFTNDGALTVVGSTGGPSALGGSLTILSLTNYDASANRLAGGTYDITASSGSPGGIPGGTARLTVAGADIVRNSASIILEITGNGTGSGTPAFTDENGNSALAHFAENEAAGVFQLKSLRQPFQTASDFENAGTVGITLSSLQIPASHVYRQVGGVTTLSGGTISGNVELLGGQLVSVEAQLPTLSTIYQGGAINGNLIVASALLNPISLGVNGSVQLSDSSRFLFRRGITGRSLAVQSTLSLAGILEIAGFSASSSATYMVAHAAAISGVFSNAPNGGRVPTMDGQGSFVVTYSSTDVTLSNYQPTVPSTQLLNISTRAQVLTGNDVAIGGFIVTGSVSKNVVIRAIGPSLPQAGVAARLQDPVIELHDSKGGVIATNDNWQDTQSPELIGSALAPDDERESAIFAGLLPGAYTAVVRGRNNTTGTVLVEVYDLTSGAQSKLANISTRGFIDPDHVLIGGLIAGGDAQGHVQVVVRAIGAGLQGSGVQNILSDPTLEVRDNNGGLIVANDDFGTPSSNTSTVPPALQPQNPTDAATGLTVTPGNYTVIVNGKNGTSGTALVEIYDVTN
jgi:hypothetical protein